MTPITHISRLFSHRRECDPQTRVLINYIETHRHRFGVAPICAVLSEHGIQIAPSTYYAHKTRGLGPTPAELVETYLAHQLFKLWRKASSFVWASEVVQRPRGGPGSLWAETRPRD